MSRTTTEFRQALLAIKAYPERRERLRQLRSACITPAYGLASGGGSPGDPTAQAATRTLPGKQQEELEAVERAIDRTLRRSEGEAVMTVIELRFFRKTHTLAGAALAVHYSPEWARNVSGDFVRAVQAELGYS